MKQLVTAIVKVEARIDANSEKFEDPRGTLASWMDIHQTRAEATEEEVINNMDTHR